MNKTANTINISIVTAMNISDTTRRLDAVLFVIPFLQSGTSYWLSFIDSAVSLCLGFCPALSRPLPISRSLAQSPDLLTTMIHLAYSVDIATEFYRPKPKLASDFVWILLINAVLLVVSVYLLLTTVLVCMVLRSKTIWYRPPIVNKSFTIL